MKDKAEEKARRDAMSKEKLFLQKITKAKEEYYQLQQSGAAGSEKKIDAALKAFRFNLKKVSARFWG